MLRLPIVAAGTVNAVAFWFDLHLDDEESITTGGCQGRGRDAAFRSQLTRWPRSTFSSLSLISSVMAEASQHPLAAGSG